MKKILAIVLAAIMVLSFAACTQTPVTPGNPTNEPGGDTTPTAAPQPGGNTDDKPLAGTYDIKIWVAEKAVDLTKTQIDNYNKTNEDGIVINATIEAVSEADAGTNMITDVEAGGDLYCFAQDQFARLVQAGALAKLGQGATKTVSEANDPGVVAAATVGEDLYAYPLTSDNGYFMYYDKSVIPDADVDSLEKLIADCEANNKYFAFELQTSAWYIASFFFGTGCVSEWTTDSDGGFVSVKDTFDSPEGLIAAKGIKKLVDSPMHISSSGAAEFNSGAAILVSGTWAYEDVKSVLGDNLGATDLPSFEVDGKEYHLGSFNGCKLMGVKPTTDATRLAVLHRVAQYLTSEEAQLERFDALSWGPSNSNAQNNERVQANPGLAALLKQNAYSIPQGQIHGSWWDIAKVIGEDIKNATDEAGLQAALDNYQAKIEALFNMTEDEKNAWGAIGTINGTNWDTDIAMTEVSENVFQTEALELHAGEEFKCRQGGSWDVNFGVTFNGDNVKVEEDGTYIIQLTITGEQEGAIELLKQ